MNLTASEWSSVWQRRFCVSSFSLGVLLQDTRFVRFGVLTAVTLSCVLLWQLILTPCR